MGRMLDNELRRLLRARLIANNATRPGTFVQPRHVGAKVRSREGPDVWRAGGGEEPTDLMRVLTEVLEESLGGPMRSELPPGASVLIEQMKRRPNFDTLVQIARLVRWEPMG